MSLRTEAMVMESTVTVCCSDLRPLRHLDPKVILVRDLLKSILKASPTLVGFSESDLEENSSC